MSEEAKEVLERVDEDGRWVKSGTGDVVGWALVEPFAAYLAQLSKLKAEDERLRRIDEREAKIKAEISRLGRQPAIDSLLGKGELTEEELALE